MASQHGRKPPNPMKVPKQHGRKPSAPKPHSNSGSSSGTGTRTLVLVGAAFVGVPMVVFALMIAYLVHGYYVS